jgi:hypothetical protein
VQAVSPEIHRLVGTPQTPRVMSERTEKRLTYKAWSPAVSTAMTAAARTDDVRVRSSIIVGGPSRDMGRAEDVVPNLGRRDSLSGTRRRGS